MLPTLYRCIEKKIHKNRKMEKIFPPLWLCRVTKSGVPLKKQKNFPTSKKHAFHLYMSVEIFHIYMCVSKHLAKKIPRSIKNEGIN